MNIEPFRADDIEPFLQLAAAESWVAEPWEFRFLLAEFPQGCFVARNADGESTGFVTSLRHENSAWIGNLIVSAEHRGLGIGEQLFVRVLNSLRAVGVETIWLTASKSGRSLYEKHGFGSIDTIVRWVGSGRGRPVAQDQSANREVLTALSHGLDAQAWGDCRSTLLETTTGRGRLLQNEAGMIVLQPCGTALQIGPFSASDADSAERLFDSAARTFGLGTKIMVDAPASNRAALQLFNRRKMRIAGNNELMYAGRKPEYCPKYLYGLATMGSCG
jgi:ribosomal protein S18 acetylase RimI-like enzyme